MRGSKAIVAVVGLVVGVALAPGLAAGRDADGADRPMSAEWTRRTMDAYLAAVAGEGSVAGYFADDVVIEVVGSGQETKGREAVADLHDAAAGRVVVTRLVVGEGRAAAEAELAGGLPGMAPGEPRMRAPYGVFYELAYGEITALRIYGPGAGLPWQLRGAAE